jgi:hypothetical protein
MLSAVTVVACIAGICSGCSLALLFDLLRWKRKLSEFIGRIHKLWGLPPGSLVVEIPGRSINLSSIWTVR